MIFNQAARIFLPMVLLCAAATASTIFNFDGNSLGTSTTFTDTVNGLSATFLSSADPGGFVVYPTMFETLTGNVLGDPGPAFQDNLALDAVFSQNLSAITLDFATTDFLTPSPFTLTAYEKSALVGSATLSGQFLPGFTFPEGEIAFAGGPFDQIVLTSTAADFAVDNINVPAGVNTSAVPEPGTLCMLGTGLILLGSVRRRNAAQITARILQSNKTPKEKKTMKISVPFVCPASTKMAAFALLSLSASLASAQSTKSIFPLLPPVVSTVPSNGDVNPYGVAFGPRNLPAGPGLQAGDILVSNFNDAQNLQGLGTTILRIDRSGATSTFFTSPRAQSGLSAALGVLSNGIVLIGNLPTADGTSATAQAGRLAVLDPFGQFLGTFGTPSVVDGPWGMAVYDTGNGVSGTAHVFLSNVLSGVVSRFDITYTATSIGATALVLANGFNHRPDPAALELGPSGLAYNATTDTLYVASSYDNAIYEIPKAVASQAAVTTTLFVQDFTHLHGPLDLAILPNGHFVVANSDGSNVDPNQPSELVEYSATGQFLGQMSIDPNNGGAFGLAVNNMGWGTIRLAAVDDNQNSLHITTTVLQ